MQPFNLTSYILAIAFLLAMIFTVSWGVRRVVVKVTDSVTAKTSRIKPSL